MGSFKRIYLEHFKWTAELQIILHITRGSNTQNMTEISWKESTIHWRVDIDGNVQYVAWQDNSDAVHEVTCFMTLNLPLQFFPGIGYCVTGIFEYEPADSKHVVLDVLVPIHLWDINIKSCFVLCITYKCTNIVTVKLPFMKGKELASFGSQLKPLGDLEHSANTQIMWLLRI